MAIKCASCRRENDPWRKYCGGCGSGLAGGCKSCGSVNRLDDKFCGGCGKAQRAIPSVGKPQTFDTTTPIDIAQIVSETNA